MKKRIPPLRAALLGLLFGAGLALSGMINPAKVLNFFDVFGGLGCEPHFRDGRGR